MVTVPPSADSFTFLALTMLVAFFGAALARFRIEMVLTYAFIASQVREWEHFWVLLILLFVFGFFDNIAREVSR